MKYTLQDLQEEKVYIELTCDEDFDKLLPYTNIAKCGTNVKHSYPFHITLNLERASGWCSDLKWFEKSYGFNKIKIEDLFFDLNDLENEACYIELKNKQNIKDWEQIIKEKLPIIAEEIFIYDNLFISFYDKSFTLEEESYIKDEYKKVDLEFINKILKENIKTKLLTFTINGESTYNLEIKWEDWELLKQGNKLKLL